MSLCSINSVHSIGTRKIKSVPLTAAINIVGSGTYTVGTNTNNSADTYVTYIFTGNGALAITNINADVSLNVLAVGGGGSSGTNTSGAFAAGGGGGVESNERACR